MYIFDNSLSSIQKTIYCERYVNNGSPSGFTFVNTTSVGTRAFDKVRYIKVPVISFNSSKYFSYFGNSIKMLSDNQIVIHPDMLNDISNDRDIKSIEFVDAIPLASNRTVFIPQMGKYLKLQYNGLIGRIERLITVNRARHAIAVNDILCELNWDGTPLHFFQEEHARIYSQDNQNTIGMVVRDTKLFPDSNGIVVPAFSLFSKDINNPDDNSIILQLIDRVEIDKDEFVLHKIINPAISLYFKILLETGLQIEAHAQNVCYVISNNNISIALRDFESVDKDLEIAPQYNQRFNKEYKCFGSASPDYAKRHSFMFDFKLGEYLITPILEEAQKAGCNIDYIVEKVRQFVSHYIKLLPKNYFPKDCWYSFPKCLIDRTTNKRPYEKNDCPKYR